MTDKFLYEELDAVSKMDFLKKEVPDFLKDNLNPKFELNSGNRRMYSVRDVTIILVEGKNRINNVATLHITPHIRCGLTPLPFGTYNRGSLGDGFIIFKLLGHNLYWNPQLKKNNSFEKRFDKPYMR